MKLYCYIEPRSYTGDGHPNSATLGTFLSTGTVVDFGPRDPGSYLFNTLTSPFKCEQSAEWFVSKKLSLNKGPVIISL